MNEVVKIIGMSLLVLAIFYTSNYEAKKEKYNKNDERWQAIKSKSDRLTLTFVEIISVTLLGILTFGSWGIVQRISVIKQLAQPNNLAQLLSIFLYIFPFAIFIFRNIALRHFDKNM